MKRFLLFSLLLFSMGVFAEAPYKHSIGFVGGSMNGLSYKTFVREHYVVQTDAGASFNLFGGLMGIFKVNPMFMYQASMYEDSYGNRIDWYSGGGISLGFMTSELYGGWRYFGGEFGFNAIAGIEFAFSRALALSFDFRPGYGLNYGGNYGEESFFDWGFQLGMHFYL